ncbi:hypothetical protein ACLOJK_029719 [Asimina triloba]
MSDAFFAPDSIHGSKLHNGETPFPDRQIRSQVSTDPNSNLNTAVAASKPNTIDPHRRYEQPWELRMMPAMAHFFSKFSSID